MVKPMTVKQLRARLAKYPADAAVVDRDGDPIRQAYSENWYMGVGFTRKLRKCITLKGW